ncbi:hypothetical protein Droror1_Dr00002884 [Drosera rotundifolia]
MEAKLLSPPPPPLTQPFLSSAATVTTHRIVSPLHNSFLSFPKLNTSTALCHAATMNTGAGGGGGRGRIEGKEAKLWGERFEESITDVVERFTESISFDFVADGGCRVGKEVSRNGGSFGAFIGC